MKKVKKRLYHFLNANYGLQCIRDRRLRISRLSELNDPFEFLAPATDDATRRQALIRTKRQLGERRGVLCFCEEWHNPLMWSHYADKHRGICLGFDVAEDFLNPVTYVEQRLEWPAKLDEAFVQRICKTKFSQWSYEQESRAFVALDREEERCGHYFMPFSEELALRLVIVGAESQVTRADVDTAIDGLERVEKVKARVAFQHFRVVRQQSESFWT